jgi:hypothetical protein
MCPSCVVAGLFGADAPHLSPPYSKCKGAHSGPFLYHERGILPVCARHAWLPGCSALMRLTSLHHIHEKGPLYAAFFYGSNGLEFEPSKKGFEFQ